MSARSVGRDLARDLVRAAAWGLVAGGLVVCSGVAQERRAERMARDLDAAAREAARVSSDLAARGTSAAGGAPDPFSGWAAP